MCWSLCFYIGKQDDAQHLLSSSLVCLTVKPQFVQTSPVSFYWLCVVIQSLATYNTVTSKGRE